MLEFLTLSKEYPFSFELASPSSFNRGFVPDSEASSPKTNSGSDPQIYQSVKRSYQTALAAQEGLERLKSGLGPLPLTDDSRKRFLTHTPTRKLRSNTELISQLQGDRLIECS